MDLYEALKTMRVYVAFAEKRVPDVFDGLSCEDLPMVVLLKFLESPNGLGYDPMKGPLDNFLTGVLKNELKSHLRRHRHSAGSLDDPIFMPYVLESALAHGKFLSQTPDQGTNTSDERLEKLLLAASDDPSLTELIKASTTIDSGANINQLLAKTLHTTPADIVNRKKRLIRKYYRAIANPVTS